MTKGNAVEEHAKLALLCSPSPLGSLQLSCSVQDIRGRILAQVF